MGSGLIDAETVGTVLTVVALIGLPVVAAFALFSDRSPSERWRRAKPMPSSRPIELLSADLRRLHNRLETTENDPESSGKGLKLRAIRRAYVDCLCAAGQELEVSALPRIEPRELVPQSEVYRLESELRRRGLEVREPAGR